MLFPARARLLQTVGFLWLALACLISLWSLWAHFQIGLNNDHLVLMHQAKKLLAGAQPYVDYADVSPPLIHLLYIVPILLSRVLGAPLDSMLYLLVDALIFVGVGLSDAILKYSGAGRIFRAVAASALALALLFMSFIHQPFADREHIMLVLITPWLVLFSPYANKNAIPPRLRFAAAVMAAVGFAIKPYFYVFYLATIVGQNPRLLLRQREHQIVLGFGAVYTLIVLLFFREYVWGVVPLAMHTYAAIAWPWGSKWNVVTGELFSYVLPSLIAMGFLWFIEPRAPRRGMGYLCLLLLAAVLSYLVNGGWYYTQYPFIAVALVWLVLVGARLAEACRHAAVLLLDVLIVGAVFYAIFATPALSRAGWDIAVQRERGHPIENIEIHPPARAKIDAALDAHPRYIYLGTSVFSVNLLKANTPRDEVGRFDILWPLPGLLALGQDASQQATYAKYRDYFTGALAADLARHAPDMVINDVSPVQRGLPLSYNALGLLKQDARFAGEWQNYRLSEVFDTCSDKVRANCAYEIYLRKVK